MIINKLLAEQIPIFWEHIKYAAVSANNLHESSNIESYCRSLLINLMASNYTCWVCINKDNESIIGIAITKIWKDAGNIPHLLIDTVYVYQTSSDDQKHDFINNIKVFAKDIGCNDIIFYTNNPRIIQVADRLGFHESSRVYRANIGG